ncbi:cytochrome c peroxidase [Larkinella harenae]
MKPSTPLVLLATTLLAVVLLGWLDSQTVPLRATERAQAQFARDLATLDQLVVSRLAPLAERSRSSDSLQTAFLACRRAYKKLEPFTEYYFPATTRLVNGPALPEIEAEEGKLFEPGGFQVIEEMLFPRFDPRDRDGLTREIRKLRRELGRYSDLWKDTELTDAHIFDALRLQLFRITTLGISGFDTPICQTAIPEAASAIESIRAYVALYAIDQDSVYDQLLHRLEHTQAYLRQPISFDAFDRARFITTYANPLSQHLLHFQQQRFIPPFQEIRPLRANAPTLFSPRAFNPDFYAPSADLRTNPAKVLLGEQLFSDPILSISDGGTASRRSCASCHQPFRAFSDGLPKNATLSAARAGHRNTPTLLNAALQSAQFYDLRSETLENQSSDVIHNPDEMHGSLVVAARLLQQNPLYLRRFKRAFPRMGTTIQPLHIQNALAAYERSLISLNSRFDQHMRGQRSPTGKPLLSTEELAGFNLFMGKAKCGTCHFLPLFNGTVPPAFAHTESEIIGVPVQPGSHQIDPDPGRYARFPLAALRYSFKTPTIRNSALTAPYMHNGSFKTLAEVIDFYDQGGGRGLGIALANQTLPDSKLNLTSFEKAALVAFLRSLNSLPAKEPVLVSP